MEQISPESFLIKLKSGRLKDSLVLDVREPEEWNYYHLDGTELMPMRTIPMSLEKILGDKQIYVICAHGVRSKRVCRFLLHQGKKNIINVRGGIAAVSGLQGFQYD